MERAALCLVLLLGLTPAARAQERGDVSANQVAYIEALRREDPAAADRFVALLDARKQALADVQQTERRAAAMPPDLRASFLPQIKSARRAYVDAETRILDFLDARDRAALARLNESIARINAGLDERRKARDELKKLLID